MYNVHIAKTPVLVVDTEGKIIEYKNLNDLFDYWNEYRAGDLRWNDAKYVLDKLRRDSYVGARAFYNKHSMVIIKPTEAF